MDSIRPFILPALVILYAIAGVAGLLFPERRLKTQKLKQLRRAGRKAEARELRARNAKSFVTPEDAPRLKRTRLAAAMQVLIFAIVLWKMGPTLSMIYQPIPAQAGAPAPGLEEIIEKNCAEFLRDGKTPGMVVAAISGTNHAVLGFGRATAKGDTPVGENTLFEIGSITKAFTGLALAHQVQAGEVRLQQPIAELIPPGIELPESARSVTLQHLTTHTSGFPRLPGKPRIASIAGMLLFGGNPYAGLDETRFREGLRDLQLESEPGQKQAYSNFGASLLGWLIARQAGSNYETLVQRTICGPLGMRDTVIALLPPHQERCAEGHRATLKLGPLLLALPSSSWDLPDHLAGAGGLRSTGADMLKFLEANLNPPSDPLGQAIRQSQQELFRDNERTAIGMNWLRTKDDRFPETLLWHNGGTGGFRGFIGFLENSRAGIVILSNSAQSVDHLGITLLRELSQSSPAENL